ncbi:trypsin-like serine protease [Polyangium spumosum]|uniref:Trypsin-like serine protease n=1 Tax=Polyangium spumosum TaxID=889282 RepID=A0A6N7PQH7_9BACT|nr:trypsin-like serine protease [Polyangium spumosum]MRG93056.1 trypsin-like serine protease [Polyangium spumosum]
MYDLLLSKRAAIAPAAILPFLFALGCGAAGEDEGVDGAESAIMLGDGNDTSSPARNAVVRIETGGGLCTGTLVASDLVLTAGHCVDMLRTPGTPTGDWNEWETPGAWYTFQQPITIRIGLTTSSTITRTSTQYSLPSGNDAFLLRLSSPVSSSIAAPSKVMTRLPANVSAASFFGTTDLEMVGFGGTGRLVSLGGSVARTPGCVSAASNRLNCFARDDLNKLTHRRYDGTWQPWVTNGSVSLEGTPSCVSWGTNRIDCFYRRTDSRLGHLWSNDNGATIPTPEDLGGAIASDPECVSWGSGRLDCFARGGDNRLKHIWYQSNVGWGAWATLGTLTFSGKPSCVAWGSNRLDCFVRDTSNTVDHIYWNGSAWSPWESMGAQVVYSDPRCVSHASNNIDCVARGSDSALKHLRYNGAWQPWANRGGLFTGAPTCSSWGVNRLDCFGYQNGELLHAAVISGSWTPWLHIGHGILNDPSCVSWGTNRIDCMAHGQGNVMRAQWWDGSAWSGGELATTRQVGRSLFTCMGMGPGCYLDSPNKFLVQGVTDDVVRGGDSGGPLFVTDSSGQRWVVGVVQGYNGDYSRYTATFGTGGPDPLGRNVGSMRNWLENALGASQTGTPQ